MIPKGSRPTLQEPLLWGQPYALYSGSNLFWSRKGGRRKGKICVRVRNSTHQTTHTLHHLLLTLPLTYSILEPILCNPFKDPLLRCAHIFAWTLDELWFCVSPSNAFSPYSINPAHLAGFLLSLNCAFV